MTNTYIDLTKLDEFETGEIKRLLLNMIETYINYNPSEKFPHVINNTLREYGIAVEIPRTGCGCASGEANCNTKEINETK